MKQSIQVALCLFVLISFAFTTIQNSKKQGVTVVIDVSHGGNDAGVIIESTSEKELVQQIAAKIVEANENKHVKIHLTRTDDASLSLQQRVSLINKIKPDVVLSLHINSDSDGNVNGTELFLSEDSPTFKKSYRIAEKLKETFIASELVEKAVVDFANHYLLKNSNYPTVTVELGYISNPTDFYMLTSEAGQTKIATAVVEMLSTL